MWHEARKQERMIRGMIVDYRRRAERRKDFYEKIKAEPTQFLQLHGRPCKIHLDPVISAAGEGPAIMMPWQGDTTNMIDRFDVRAHLDYIPEVRFPDIPPEELAAEERQCNYERYRILAQNVFLGISEDKFLQQLAIEEQFGVTLEEKEMQKEKLHNKKGTGAAIGYNYNDPGAQPSCSNGPEPSTIEEKESDDDSDFEIIDVDLSIDVNKMEASQAHELNAVGPQFGMAGCDLFSFLTGDADDAEHQKQLLREEKEKAMFSGRKSRRERRAHRDKKLATRVVSPPSYAAPTRSANRSASRSASRSRSRSRSLDAPDTIQFITSFGGDDDDAKLSAPSKPLYSEKLKQNLKKVELYSDVAKKPKSNRLPQSKRPRLPIGPRGPNSRSRSRSYSRSRSRSRSPSRSRLRSRSRSRSRLRSRSRSQSRNSRSWRKSRSKSRSYSRSASSRSRSKSLSPYRKSKSRSRSRSRNYRIRQSRSPTNYASGYPKSNNCRSISFESEKSAAPKPVPRYYGRRKEDKSSSELSLDSASSDSADDDTEKLAVGNKSNTNQNQIRLSGSSSKGASRETLTLKEKLKRKMQAQLSRQLRADKRQEAERQERESRRRARRDREMRDLAIKLRRKQREMRHQQNRRSSEEDSDKSHSGSSSRESPKSQSRKDERSRSKSPCPPQKRIPVWDFEKDPSSGPYRQKPQDFSERTQQETKKKYEDPESYYKDDRRSLEEIRRSNEEMKRSNEEMRRSNEEMRQNYSRTDPYTDRHEYSRNEYNQNRWDSNRGYHSKRRPYGHRGGYRGHSSRYSGSEYHRDGPSTWNSREQQQKYDKDSSEGYSKSKVKLVDY